MCGDCGLWRFNVWLRHQSFRFILSCLKKGSNELLAIDDFKFLRFLIAMTNKVGAINKFMQTSGDVTAMDDFLKKFFYEVWERKQHAHENNYCKYDNQKLKLFTSSLYIAALIASFC